MESRGLSPATFNAAKKVLGRALRRAKWSASSIAMSHLSQWRIYPNTGFMVGDTPVKGKERRSMTPLGTSSLRSGISRYSFDQDQVHCEGLFAHSVPSLPTAQLDTLQMNRSECR